MSTTVNSTMKDTEIIVDLIGPIIDISKITVFSDIERVRYLHENEIVDTLNNRRLGGGLPWSTKLIFEHIIDVLGKKSRVSILDKQVVKLLLKAKTFADVKIISGVPSDKLFEATKELVVDYSEFICLDLNKKEEIDVGDRNFSSFKEENFKHFHNVEEKRAYLNEKGKHRIIFDDEIDIKILTEAIKNGLTQEWISGISDDDCLEKLTKIIENRQLMAMVDEDISNLIKDNNKILIENYAVKANFNFYVFDANALKKLRNYIDSIQGIIKSEDNKEQSKPICVFLAGVPGTGKSYFVNQLAKYLGADDDYPVASLSGVPEDEFAEAVRSHIDEVYNKKSNKDKNVHIAFLDEVDTDGGSSLAFRLLMDAMSGNATDKKGVKKPENTKKLVWLFAGSAALNRDGFLVYFNKAGRKIEDFFDRIHFEISLPSVQRPGQAILTFLCSLEPPEGMTNITVSKSVLYLFGRTAWKSTRQIKTICRIVNSKFTWSDISLKHFEEIESPVEFVNTLKDIKKKESNGIFKDIKINIIFPG
jgi:hypothetical protein